MSKLEWWGELFETEEPDKPARLHPYDLHCLGCGRFAKFAGERHYYNGQFNCYSYDTNCSKCGVLTVECV